MQPPVEGSDKFAPFFVFETCEPNNIWLVTGKTDKSGYAKAMFASGNRDYKPFTYVGTIIMAHYTPLQRVRIMIG